MSVTRCAICWQPVGRDKSEPDSDGNPCHVTCLHPSPEMQLLDSLLGPTSALAREREAPVIMAAELGHVVTWTVKQGSADRKPWSCTCGLNGIGADAKRNHLKQVAIDG